MLKGVLFDLDGVITDTSNYHFLAWKAIADEIGIKIDEKFNEQLKGVSRTDSLKRIIAYGHKEDEISPEEFDQLLEQKNNYYLQYIDKLQQENILPGILDLLKSLKQNNVKIALASVSKNGPRILQKLAIDQYFDAIVDPAKVAHGKPAPDIYEAAALAIDVPKDECLGIEDAIAGVQAINSAGIYSVGVGDKVTLGEADVVVPDTSYLTYDFLAKQLA